MDYSEMEHETSKKGTENAGIQNDLDYLEILLPSDVDTPDEKGAKLGHIKKLMEKRTVGNGVIDTIDKWFDSQKLSEKIDGVSKASEMFEIVGTVLVQKMGEISIDRKNKREILGDLMGKFSDILTRGGKWKGAVSDNFVGDFVAGFVKGNWQDGSPVIAAKLLRILEMTAIARKDLSVDPAMVIELVDNVKGKDWNRNAAKKVMFAGSLKNICGALDVNYEI